jgi:hypothetical protein
MSGLLINPSHYPCPEKAPVLKRLVLKLCGISLLLFNSSYDSCSSSHAFTHSILLHVEYHLEYIPQGTFFEENGDEQANRKSVYYHLQPRNCVAHFRFLTAGYLFSIFGEVSLRSGLLVLIILLEVPQALQPKSEGQGRFVHI